MDVLSDVLRAVRLTGAVYFEVRARAPWVAETPSVTTVGSRVMPGFGHVIAFHAMMEGRGVAQLADHSEPPLPLESGDAVIFVDGDAHLLASEPGVRAKPDPDLYYRPDDRPLPFVLDELGGCGDPARFVCGFLGCDARPYNPILDALPRVLHLRAPGDGRGLTTTLIRAALDESDHPRAGSETMLARLSELVFLQALRQHVDDLPPQATGWLAGLRDPQIGAALRHIHGRPADPWTLEALAREIGMSRSAFVERFTQLIGVAPMHYCGMWRLQLAAGLLERDTMSLAQIASVVGYESEAAFNRAFKRHLGQPPGAWRRARLEERRDSLTRDGRSKQLQHA